MSREFARIRLNLFDFGHEFLSTDTYSVERANEIADAIAGLLDGTAAVEVEATIRQDIVFGRRTDSATPKDGGR